MSDVAKTRMLLTTDQAWGAGDPLSTGSSCDIDRQPAPMTSARKGIFRILNVGIFLLLTVGAASADVLTFNSRAEFEAAVPGLQVETFETGAVAAGGLTTCDGPVSSDRPGGCFPAGGLLPGVVFGTGAGALQPGIAVLGAGYGTVGNSSVVIGPNFFYDTLNITFTEANAVGFDVFAGSSPGNVLISVYDASGSLQGAYAVFAPAGGVFFGLFSSRGIIGRIDISSQAPMGGELIDNLSFGRATAIPEPATLLLLGTGAAYVVGLKRRRRRTL